MNRFFFALIGMLAISACATTPMVDPASVEHMRAQAPTGWVAGMQTQTSVLRMSEYLSPDTTAEGWSEKITFERLTATPVPDANEFVASMRADHNNGCENAQFHNTYSGEENGYATEVALMTCPRQVLTQLGQVTMMKVIQGNDALYTITRAKRIPPFNDEEPGKSLPQEEIAQWSFYLRAISVCDPTRSDRHPCG